MKNPTRLLSLLAFCVVTVSVGQAHPGHENEIIPFLLRPFAGVDHFLASLSAAVFAGGVVWLGARRAGINAMWRRVAVGGVALAAVVALA